MKLLLLNVILVLAFVKIKSQTWCPSGATWHHQVHTVSQFYENYGNIEIKYTGTDTVINGITCKELLSKRKDRWQNEGQPPHASSFSQFYYTYESNHVVYILDPYKSVFDTLADFNASIGQQWQTVSCQGFEQTAIIVTDTSHILINGQSLKKLKVSFKMFGFLTMERVFIEKIGGYTSFLFIEDIDCVADGEDPGSFVCYQDDSFPLFMSEYATECEIALTIKENDLNNPIHIYPQPAHELVTIDLSNSLYSRENLNVILTDLSGREVKHEPLKKQLDLNGLNAGLYLLTITDAKGRPVYVQKLLKQG